MRNTFLLVLAFSLPTAGATENNQLKHENVRWSRLVYEASAFFVTLESEVKLQSIDKTKAIEDLVMKGESNLLYPKGERLFRIDTFAEGFGKETRYSLWINPDGEVLQRKKVLSGKKNEIKLYRFSPCAFYTLRQKFPSKKFDRNFNQWNDSHKKYAEFDPELCDSWPVYDVNSLLYLISALDISDVGFEREVLAFSKGDLFKVKIVAKKNTTIYSEFKIKSPNGKEEIDDDIDVLRVDIVPQVSNKNERDKFKFLGLKGNVKVYLDTARKLVVRLSGKVKVLGSIDINLKKAELVN